MDDKTNKNLQEAGLKATLPRIKILEIMQRTAGTEDHYTAEDIYKELVMNSYDTVSYTHLTLPTSDLV